MATVSTSYINRAKRQLRFPIKYDDFVTDMNVTHENPDMNVTDMNVTDENSEHSDDSIEIENYTTSSIILRNDESEQETTIAEAQSQSIDEIHPHQNTASIPSDSVDISQ